MASRKTAMIIVFYSFSDQTKEFFYKLPRRLLPAEMRAGPRKSADYFRTSGNRGKKRTVKKRGKMYVGEMLTAEEILGEPVVYFFTRTFCRGF